LSFLGEEVTRLRRELDGAQEINEQRRETLNGFLNIAIDNGWPQSSEDDAAKFLDDLLKELKRPKSIPHDRAAQEAMMSAIWKILGDSGVVDTTNGLQSYAQLAIGVRALADELKQSKDTAEKAAGILGFRR